MKSTTFEEKLRDKITGELRRMPPEVARRLFPRTPPSLERMSEPAFIAMVRENWQDPEFRQDLYKSQGSRLLEIAEKAFPEYKLYFEAMRLGVEVPHPQMPDEVTPALPGGAGGGGWIPPDQQGAMTNVATATTQPAAPVSPLPGMDPGQPLV